MATPQAIVLTGRQVRSVWREQEEQFIADSIHYAKRNMSLREYLINVAQAGHELTIKTHYFATKGVLVHVGENFVSLISTEHPRLIQSFVLRHDLEFEVGEKSARARSQRLIRHDKSFRSLLDDISHNTKRAEIETVQGNIYAGECDLFADCVIVSDTNNDMTLVNDNAAVVPVEGIVSVVYAI